MTILLKPDHFAFLNNKAIELYSDKLEVLAQAQERVAFSDDNEVKDFMDAVITGDYILGDTGKFYINMKQPVNVINGTHEEEFLQLEKRSSINPNTKVKEVDFDIAFENFENATLFDEDSVNDLPNNMKIYAAAEFRLPEIEAVKIYGDYDKWLKSYLKDNDNENIDDTTNTLDEVSSSNSDVEVVQLEESNTDVSENTESNEDNEVDEQIKTIRNYKEIISDSMNSNNSNTKQHRANRKVKASVKAK